MAHIVGGVATSHGPLLSTPASIWHLRGEADRKSVSHWYRGEMQDYATLLARRVPGFAAEVAPAEQERRHAACQQALDSLAARWRALRADVAVIVGNDQREVFKEDLVPALCIYTGQNIENIPLGAERSARLPPGLAEAEEGHCPHEGAVYPGLPGEATLLASALSERGFDVAASARLSGGPDRQAGIPHAFGFIYRRILEDAPPPSIPVFINVGVAPNQVRAPRALAFGRALAQALQALPGDTRVGLIASGGMSHFVVDEALDAKVMQALQPFDEAALAAIPEPQLQGNTAELKSWFAVAAAMHEAGCPLTGLDYTACYRTPAGTGSGMGFASWAC